MRRSRTHGDADPGRPARVSLPRSPEAVGLARRAVEALLAGAARPAALGDVKLVVSELVSNAVLHGDGEITLKVDLGRDAVRVEVVDEGEPDRIRMREPGERGGFGLHVVDALSRRWGVFEGTTHVWAELPL